MKKVLVRIIVGLGLVMGCLWFLNKYVITAFVGTQYEDIAAWLPIAFAVSVLVGLFMQMQYGEKQWYQKYKRYTVWVAAGLVVGSVIAMWFLG